LTKIKADVSGSDPDKALSVGNRKSPRPGMYVAEIDTCKYREEKNDLEVTYKITQADKEKNEQFIGSRLWSYVMLEGHASWEQTQWKLDQLLQAVGLATKKKRKVNFDTDELEGEEVVIIVVSDTNKEGEYRGAVGGVMMYDEETFAQDVEDDDDEEDEPEPDAYSDDDDDEDEAPDVEDEDEVPYDEWSLADLKAELEARELDAVKGKAKIIAALEADDESEEGDDDDEEEAEPDEAGDYDDLSVAELRSECVERGLKKNGTKDALIARLEEFDANPPEDEPEADDDDDDEEEEEAPKPRRRKPATASKSKKTVAKRSSSKSTRRKGSKDDGFPFDE